MNSTPSKKKQETDGLFRASLGFALIILLGMGFLYSLAGTALGHGLFPRQANGSIVMRDGKAVGSSLVAQPFADARYFQPRPSAAGYNPMSAAGSNQARTNPDLRKRIDEATAIVAVREGIAVADVPIELVTQSGGGLDPHISPAGAEVQIARVALARNLDPEWVREIVAAHTHGPQLGFLGQQRVNVLELNIALDAQQ